MTGPPTGGGRQPGPGQGRRGPERGAGGWPAVWRRTITRLGDERAARFLLEEASGLRVAQLLRSAGEPAPAPAVARLEALCQRVERGEPLQYVLGHWGFRSLDLFVRPSVLIPRPETEFVVEVTLGELDRLGGSRLADLGTGSGAIALAVASESPGTEVLATERSPAAIAVARENLDRLEAEIRSRVRLLEGDWFSALPAEMAGTLDVVVSNPPYVAEDEWAGLDPVVRDHEPRVALIAGPLGTEAVEVIAGGAPSWLRPRGSLVVEIAPGQKDAALRIAGAAGFADVEVLVDLAGRDRVLVARR